MLKVVEVPFEDPRVQELVAEVQAHYVVIYGSPDESPVDPGEFGSPHGSFVLGLGAEGEPVAMGGWRWRPDLSERFGWGRVAEVKRMYVVPAARGRGHARAVLAGLEASARAAGVERVVLETGTRQPDALGLYESSGYAPVESFGHYAWSPTSRYLGKYLG